MLYLLAAIGAFTIAVVLWRLLSSDRVGVPSRSRQAPVAPDDDPDFLRHLSEQQRQRQQGDDEAAD